MNLYLDMDGTIANLYGINNWLDYLIAEDTTPYRKANLMLNDSQIVWLQNWIAQGNTVSIISWLSKNGSRKYNAAVRAAKIRWLKKVLPLPYSKIHIIKYGTPKSKYGEKDSILIDDEERNLTEWKNAGGIAWSIEYFKKICIEQS